MAVWLRLTGQFGLPNEAGRTGNFVLDVVGPVLRADGREIVEEPLPPRFCELLDQIQQRNRGVRPRQSARLSEPNMSRSPSVNLSVSP